MHPQFWNLKKDAGIRTLPNQISFNFPGGYELFQDIIHADPTVTEQEERFPEPVWPTVTRHFKLEKRAYRV